MRTATLMGLALIGLVGCSEREVAVPAADPAASPEARTSIEGIDWSWVRMISPADSTWESPNRERYTLRLEGERAAGAADCNRFTASYILNGRNLAFGAMAVTRAMCPPGSLGDRYTRWLGQVASQFTRGDTLFLELKFDSGTMVFLK